MKRDMEVVRTLLMQVADNSQFNGRGIYSATADEFPVEGFSCEEIDYHFSLLFGAGLLDGKHNLSPGFVIKGVTWNGHEFLDATRDPDVWEKTKARAKGVSNTGMGILLEIAKAEIKTKLGLGG